MESHIPESRFAKKMGSAITIYLGKEKWGGGLCTFTMY
jgi:hypothetical protein